MPESWLKNSAKQRKTKNDGQRNAIERSTIKLSTKTKTKTKTKKNKNKDKDKDKDKDRDNKKKKGVL